MENLKDTRDALDAASGRRVPPDVLDALLCRLVFTCYLFDRDVIDESYLRNLRVRGASHLRDVLSLRPMGEARSALYKLFKKLVDFNGDLFSDDSSHAEAEMVLDGHLQTLDNFFQGTIVRSGQMSFWPYDFRVIPIETISAIYERFLSADHVGAFYTPRFLAEVVLDTALSKHTSLIGQRFLDPACGSGIFLVGLFNRIADEWTRANATARNDKKARELMRLLRESLFGVDIHKTACRITAFSLYLAYLDQLSPRDIRDLQEKGRALPRLIVTEEEGIGHFWCAHFFYKDPAFPTEVSLVVGNPPWGSLANKDTQAGKWCSSQAKVVPDNQIAAAFTWKAVQHVAAGGRVCFVLPYGVLFHHSPTAIQFLRILGAKAYDRSGSELGRLSAFPVRGGRISCGDRELSRIASCECASSDRILVSEDRMASYQDRDHHDRSTG